MSIALRFGHGLCGVNNPNYHTRKLTMNLTKNLGMLLLSIWLIVTGLLQVVSIQVPAIRTVLALLAIAAGILILIGR
jgi:hypothetical protein